MRKRKKSNIKAKRNLNAIKNIQAFMREFAIAGEMSNEKHTMLFKNNIPVAKSKAVSDAFYNIRFQWTMLIGVLGRTQTGELYTKQVSLTTDKSVPVLADELNQYITQNLRNIWDNFNPLHRLTGFFVCTPSDTAISETLVAQVLFKYKTPDTIATCYEIDSQTDIKENCKSIWEELFVDIQWNEISNFKPTPLVFNRLSSEERKQLERDLKTKDKQRITNGT